MSTLLGTEADGPQLGGLGRRRCQPYIVGAAVPVYVVLLEEQGLPGLLLTYSGPSYLGGAAIVEPKPWTASSQGAGEAEHTHG